MQTLRDGFEQLSGFDVKVLAPDGTELGTERHTRPGWANARDVEAVYDKMMVARNDRVFEEAEMKPRFLVADVQLAINEMLRHRPEGVSRSNLHDDAKARAQLFAKLNEMQSQQTQQTAVLAAEAEERIEEVLPDEGGDEQCVECELSGEERIAWQQATSKEKEDAIDDSKREQIRLEDERLKREEEERLKRLEKEKLEREKRKIEKLRSQFPCPAGFSWIKQGAMWRCTGGGYHTMSDAALEKMVG